LQPPSPFALDTMSSFPSTMHSYRLEAPTGLNTALTRNEKPLDNIPEKYSDILTSLNKP